MTKEEIEAIDFRYNRLVERGQITDVAYNEWCERIKPFYVSHQNWFEKIPMAYRYVIYYFLGLFMGIMFW
jgi:hypothetical protein